MQDFKGKVRGLNVEPVDTTGAGDAFVSGILYYIASDPSIFKVIQISLHILVVDLEKSCECLFCVAGWETSPEGVIFGQCMWRDHGDQERGNFCITYKRWCPAILDAIGTSAVIKCNICWQRVSD